MHNLFTLGISALDIYLHPSPPILLPSSKYSLTQHQFLQIQQIGLRDGDHSLVGEAVIACMIKFTTEVKADDC